MTDSLVNIGYYTSTAVISIKNSTIFDGSQLFLSTMFPSIKSSASY